MFGQFQSEQTTGLKVFFGHFFWFYAIKIIKHDRNIEDESIDSTEWMCQKKYLNLISNKKKTTRLRKK